MNAPSNMRALARALERLADAAARTYNNATERNFETMARRLEEARAVLSRQRSPDP